MTALLTSELVTNAVRHAQQVIELTAAHVPPELMVSVCDDGEGWPTVTVADTASTTGRGMGLVEALADRWGADTEGNGKVVWFALTAG